MLSIKPSSKTRRRKSGGQALVESSFTLIPLLALIWGIADFGFMIFRWTTLQNAVREGCRYAVTFQLDSTGHQITSIQDQVSTYALGFAPTANIKVNFYAATSPFGASTNQPGNIVQVSVQGVSFGWMAPLSGNGFTLRSTTPLTLNIYASDILGGYPAGTGTSGIPQ